MRERIGPDENILGVIIHYRLSLMDIKTNSFFRLSKYIKLTDETRKIDFIILIDYTIAKWRDDNAMIALLVANQLDIKCEQNL